MFSLGSAQMNSLTGILISTSTPDATQRGFAWIKLVGTAPVGIFAWNSTISNWVWPNLAAAGGYDRRLYAGDLTSLQTYDGGEVGIVGDCSGPMWEEDTSWQGRSPMGVGAIPNTLDSLTLGSNYGEGKHLQTVDEVGPHTHACVMDGIKNSGDDSGKFCAGQNFGGPHPDVNTQTNNRSSSTQAQNPFNVVHPVRGIYIIKRTARIYYRGN